MEPDLTHQFYARRLLERDWLTTWERKFLRAVASIPVMTDRQEEVLLKIVEKYEKLA